MSYFASTWRYAVAAACVIGTATVAPARAFAQQAAPAPVAPVAPVVSNEIPDRDHVLGPGDVIEITVERYPDLSRTVTLFSDGTIDHPTIGAVQCAGYKTGELALRLVEAFKKELRRPTVHVALRSKYVPPKVEVKVEIPKITALGAVSRKGMIELPQPKPLRLVLAEITPTADADLTKICVRYPDGTRRFADFSQFDLKGESEDDFLIKGGEEIILTERPAVQKPDPIKFKVLGEGVNKPGEITTEGNISILEAIERAGGFKPSADLELVEVFGPNHKQTKIVDVEKYMFGDVTANYVVQGTDVIKVPLKKLEISVLGEVGRPGVMNIRETETLLSVYLAAGRSTGGDATKAQLIRRGKDGKAVFKVVNIREIEKQKKPDLPLMAGDVVFVPHKKTKRGLVYYLQAIATPLWLARSISPVP